MSLVCHKSTLLAHVQHGVHQDPQALFCQAAFQMSGPQPGVVPPQVRDFALLFVDLPEVPVISFLQPVEVPSGWQHDPLMLSATPHSFLSSANLLMVLSVLS